MKVWSKKFPMRWVLKALKLRESQQFGIESWPGGGKVRSVRGTSRKAHRFSLREGFVTIGIRIERGRQKRTGRFTPIA
jgi:hypothetical protein